jgi:hypothetical protein
MEKGLFILFQRSKRRNKDAIHNWTIIRQLLGNYLVISEKRKIKEINGKQRGFKRTNGSKDLQRTQKGSEKE